MEKQITLKEILDPISVDLFFKEYWGKKHLVIRRNKFKDLFHWGHLTKYINRYPHIPHLQILDYDDKDNRWCLDKRRKGKLKGPMFTKHGIHSLWKKGKSMVIPFASYESKQLVDLLFEFEKYFKRGQVNVYASPSAGSKSFPAHGDQTDNFLFHQYGKVKWTMYKESIPDKPETIIDEFVLDAGDLLYIPSYQYHKVDTVGPRILCSIHFSNKDKQTLENFKVTDDKDNKRDKWIDMSDVLEKPKKQVIINRRFPMSSQNWKRPYFKHNQKK